MGKFKTNEEKRKEKKEIISAISLITQLGIVMISSIFIGVFIGIYLDKYLNTTYIFTLVFSLFGIFAAFRNMYIYTMKKK